MLLKAAFACGAVLLMLGARAVAYAQQAPPAPPADAPAKPPAEAPPADTPPADAPPADAPPADRPSESPPAPEPSEAERLGAAARAKVDIAEYAAAIALFQQAIEALPVTPEAQPARSLLIYELSGAYLKLHALEGDDKLLKKAKLMLEGSRAGAGADEHARIDARIAEIDALLAPPAPPPVAPPPAVPAVPVAPVVPPPQPAEPPVTVQPDRPSGASKALKASGGVLVGLSAAAGLIMIPVGLVMRSSAESDLERGPWVADVDAELRDDYATGGNVTFAGILVAAIGVPAGIGLLVTGAVLPREAAVAPEVGTDRAGATLRVRF